MNNALIREHTKCGSCDELKDVCAIRTVKTVHAGWQMVELCETCLSGMFTVLKVFNDKCEHGVGDCEFCEDCSKEYKRAAEENE